MEIAKSSKLIGIGEEGINTLESMSHKLNANIDLEKINIKQDVDKDYVRALLDGVDVLFLTYSSDNKEALNIVKAIGIMANERRVLSIGLNSSTKEIKDSLEIDREIKINNENTDKLLGIFNMMLDSMLDSCMINIDLTDLKEVIIGENGLKYSYEEFDKTLSYDEKVKVLFDNMINTNQDLSGKKGLILLEMGLNDFNPEDMVELNNLLTLIQGFCEDTYETIFSMYLKEELNGKVRIGLIYN